MMSRAILPHFEDVTDVSGKADDLREKSLK
jgi:hypothetical protein